MCPPESSGTHQTGSEIPGLGNGRKGKTTPQPGATGNRNRMMEAGGHGHCDVIGCQAMAIEPCRYNNAAGWNKRPREISRYCRTLLAEMATKTGPPPRWEPDCLSPDCTEWRCCPASGQTRMKGCRLLPACPTGAGANGSYQGSAQRFKQK